MINEPYREYAGTKDPLKLPFMSDEELIDGQLDFHSDVSDECCYLIHLCLEQDPSSRPDFRKIQTHKWFKKESRDSVQDPPAD
ncbi:hypothetical protein KOW79_019790 [Hemibagrus wyckioides]|uniref:non-specific serine/threonine protein kinase n=1 Tax=Hemibagrus wyckioides TaxID=337641 RepID=A0A9D3SES3_9TELE|nr:hypothetical protein KOW79_019790 [Hemibagrus wyckioides]